jgi:hypothetical protein
MSFNLSLKKFKRSKNKKRRKTRNHMEKMRRSQMMRPSLMWSTICGKSMMLMAMDP